MPQILARGGFFCHCTVRLERTMYECWRADVYCVTITAVFTVAGRSASLVTRMRRPSIELLNRWSVVNTAEVSRALAALRRIRDYS